MWTNVTSYKDLTFVQMFLVINVNIYSFISKSKDISLTSHHYLLLGGRQPQKAVDGFLACQTPSASARDQPFTKPTEHPASFMIA